MAAAALALVVLTLFSMAILRGRRLMGDRLPCGCFGGRGRRSYRLLLARKSAWLWWPSRRWVTGFGPSLWAPLGDAQILPLLLAVAGAVLAFLMARDLRRRLPSGDRLAAEP